MFQRQVREALAKLARKVTSISCWLCRDGHAMYSCPYLTLDQYFFKTYRGFSHRMTVDELTKRLLMQKIQEMDSILYVARFR